MELVDSAINFPGCCALTGSATGPLVKTNRPLDARFFPEGGELYVDAVFAREIGEAAGCVMPEALAAQTAEADELRAKVETLEAEVASLTAQADALVVFVGPKIWGRAQHLRKNADFMARQLLQKQVAYMKGEVDEDVIEKATQKVIEAAA